MKAWYRSSVPAVSSKEEALHLDISHVQLVPFVHCSACSQFPVSLRLFTVILSLLSQPLLHLACPLLWSCLHIVRAQVWVSPQAFPSISFFLLSAFSLPPPVELAGGDAIFSSANSLCCFSSLFLLFSVASQHGSHWLLMSNISTGPSTCQRFPRASG